MRSPYNFDHIVIVVADLAEATDSYRKLGFEVVAGGAHEDAPTHNSLIGLADDTYLELIAFRKLSDATTPPAERLKGARTLFERMLLGWETVGNGVTHYALLPTSIDRDIERTRAHGVAMEGPAAGSRTRPDGQTVAWQVGIPDGLDLPFFCADITPRSLRVPDLREHANGVTGVAGIVVCVRDLRMSVLRYEALLGVGPRRSFAHPVAGAETAAFSLASGIVTLAQPHDGPEGDGLRRHLDQRGESACKLVLRARPGASTGILDAEATHGASIEIVSG